MKNYYTIMGLTQQATSDEVKNAYRDLAFMYHPDRHRTSPDRVQERAELMMQALNEAYEVLSRPERRSTFDQLLARYERAIGTGELAAAPVTPDYPVASNSAWSYDNYRNAPAPIEMNPTELNIYMEWKAALPTRLIRFFNPNPDTTELDTGGHPSWLALSWQGSRRLREGQAVELKLSITRLAWELEEPYLTSDLLIDSSIHTQAYRIPVRLTLAERG